MHIGEEVKILVFDELKIPAYAGMTHHEVYLRFVFSRYATIELT